MRILVIYIAVFLFSILTYGQDSKEYDLVIIIDDELMIAPEKFTIRLEGSDSSFSFTPKYHPGSLVLTKMQYDKLYSKEFKTMKIVFSYSSSYKKRAKDYYYKIGFTKKWLEYPFTILRIYNLDKWKYRMKYMPVDKDSNYAIVLDFGIYSISRLRKHRNTPDTPGIRVDTIH